MCMRVCMHAWVCVCVCVWRTNNTHTPVLLRTMHLPIHLQAHQSSNRLASVPNGQNIRTGLHKSDQAQRLCIEMFYFCHFDLWPLARHLIDLVAPNCRLCVVIFYHPCQGTHAHDILVTCVDTQINMVCLHGRTCLTLMEVTDFMVNAPPRLLISAPQKSCDKYADLASV